MSSSSSSSSSGGSSSGGSSSSGSSSSGSSSSGSSSSGSSSSGISSNSSSGGSSSSGSSSSGSSSSGSSSNSSSASSSGSSASSSSGSSSNSSSSGSSSSGSSSSSSNSSSSSSSGSCAITSKTVATQPTNQTRLKVGVGEQVILTYSDGSGHSATWNTTAGTLSPSSGVSTTWTAPDTGGQVTITAQGPSCTAKIVFTVVQPSIVTGKLYQGSQVGHVYNTASIGLQLVYYIGPDSVNFYNIQVQELQVNKPSDATGVWSQFANQPLAAGAPAGMTQTVVLGLGTLISFTAAPYYDTVWSGIPTVSQPYTSGVLLYNVPWQYKVSAGQWQSLTTVAEAFGLDADGVTLTVGKADATGTCQVLNPTTWHP